MAIALLATAAILFVTLFPFDFVAVGGPVRALARIQFDLSRALLWSDVPLNVVLFVPLGLGMAECCRCRACSTWAVVAVATSAGLLLSIFVELVQASMLERFPALSDVLANTLGAFLGGTASMRWGGLIGRSVRDVRTWFRSIPEIVQAMAALLPAALILLATVVVNGGTGMPWDPSYRLALGNEVTGDRPWDGTIGQLTITDGGSLDALIDGSQAALFSYDGRDGGTEGLGWQDGEGAVTTAGVVLGADGWLISERPVDDVSRAVAARNSVGVLVVASASADDQSGPARIVSISEDPYQRNLTLAQEGQALIIRVRTQVTGVNGTSPQLAVPGVFDDDASHVVAVTSDGASFDVAVDGERSSLRLVPEANVLLQLVPVRIDEIRISTIGPIALVFAYHALMLASWGVYLAVRRGRWPWWGLVLLGVVVPVAVELALRAVSPPGAWTPSMIVLGILSTAFGALAVGAFRIAAPPPRPTAAATQLGR